VCRSASAGGLPGPLDSLSQRPHVLRDWLRRRSPESGGGHPPQPPAAPGAADGVHVAGDEDVLFGVRPAVRPPDVHGGGAFLNNTASRVGR